MRITGGQYRSRKLETPKSKAVRPTSDKIRAALFNSINSRGLVQDAVVLDAFCGTGALGLEALSQGASKAVFIDKSRDSLSICKTNIENLGVQDQAIMLQKDTSKLGDSLDNIPCADLVFMDPPYRKGLCEKGLGALVNGGWLAKEAFIVVEMGKDETLNYPNFVIEQEKTYGNTKIIYGRL